MEHIAKMVKNCSVVVAKPERPGHPEQFGLSANNSFVSADFDLEKVGCIAGSVYGLLNGNYGPIMKENPLGLAMPVVFQPEYLRLAAAVMRLLKLENETFAAAHWRRGDQVTTRCVVKGHQHDYSVNCQSAQKFIATVEEKAGALRKNATRPLLIYVATNTQDPAELQQLHSAGYLTAMNITNVLQPYVHFSEVGLFVVEVILMCHARDFWHWGMTTVPTLVLSCVDGMKKNR
jgi:hypothetical protein